MITNNCPGRAPMEVNATSKALWVACISLILLAPAVPDAQALGFKIPNQDAEAIARGNAFIATADNPSAIYYNPAGITQLEGHHAQFGTHNLAVNSEYESLDGTSSANTRDEIATVPQFYYVASPENSRLSYGLGLYAPFGLGLEWPEDTPFRTLAIEGRLMYVSVNPVVAWELLPNLSLAAGPTFNYSNVKLRQGIGFPGGAPNDEFRFDGCGWTVGGTAGLLWKPYDRWAVGVNYRSPTTIEFEGDSSTSPYLPPSESTSAKLDFPQSVGLGVGFSPNQRWNFEVWVEWTDWDSLNSTTFKKSSGDTDFVFNWESSFLTGVGGSRYFDNGWFVSAGYFFSQNSTSEDNFNPIVPDTDLHVGSLGFGYKGERWRFALAGQLITGPARTVSGSEPSPISGETGDGEYQWFNQSVNFSVAYHF